MNKKQLIEEIKEIERKVEELKKSIPIHSSKVSMIQELEDLEEKLNAKKKMLSKTENTMEISKWKERLEREREEKDRFFLLHPQSPIPFEERKRFQGLDYYCPNPNYRLKLELHEHNEKKTVKMAYTKGNEQEFLRWGEFQFKGKKILFTTTFNRFINPGLLQRLPTAQIRFFTWLKALSTALVFRGIQTLLANQISKKVAALRERFSIYVLAVGYFFSGKTNC